MATETSGVENELKYVLYKNTRELSNNFLEINQSYIQGHSFIKDGFFIFESEIRIEIPIKKKYAEFLENKNMNKFRIRSVVENEKTKYYFTYKYPTNEGNIEIEKEISNLEYDILNQNATERIYKRRHKYFDDNTNLIWEIDFFLDQNNNIYFVMAEVEMPEGMQKTDVPDIINSNLLYQPTRKDKRFNNYNLSCVETTTKIYEEIIFQKNNEQNFKI